MTKMVEKTFLKKENLRKCFRTLQAHLQAVSGVAICQKSPEFLATVSHDRAMKVWDLRSTDSPANFLQRSLMTDVIWPVSYSKILNEET